MRSCGLARRVRSWQHVHCVTGSAHSGRGVGFVGLREEVWDRTGLKLRLSEITGLQEVACLVPVGSVSRKRGWPRCWCASGYRDAHHRCCPSATPPPAAPCRPQWARNQLLTRHALTQMRVSLTCGATRCLPESSMMGSKGEPLANSTRPLVQLHGQCTQYKTTLKMLKRRV